MKSNGYAVAAQPWDGVQVIVPLAAAAISYGIPIAASMLGGMLGKKKDKKGPVPFANVDSISQLASYLIMDRLKPIEQSAQFQQNANFLRGKLSTVAGEAKQRISDRAVTGGYFDSGAREGQLMTVERGQQEAFGSSLVELMNAFEAQRLSAVFPYLGLAINQWQAGLSGNQGGAGAGLGQFLSAYGGSFAGAAGQAGGQGTTIPTGGSPSSGVYNSGILGG